MSHAAGHDNVTAQFPLIAFGNENAAIVGQATGEGALIHLDRCAVVIAVTILALERVESPREMDGPGRGIGA